MDGDGFVCEREGKRDLYVCMYVIIHVCMYLHVCIYMYVCNCVCVRARGGRRT